MSKQFESLYIINPNLICLEKNERGLTLLHFGNTFFYSTKSADFVLKLLKVLKKPNTKKKLALIMGEENRKKFNETFVSLLSLNYICKTARTKIPKGFVFNSVLKTLVADQSLLVALTKQVLNTKVGIIDLGSAGIEIKAQIRKAGFRVISLIRISNGEKIPEVFLKKHDYFVVVGHLSQVLAFSKINQQLIMTKKLWLSATLDNFGGVIGPTFGSSTGPCFDCIIDESNRKYYGQFNEDDYVNLIQDEHTGHEKNSNNFISKSIYSLIAVELLKVVSRVARPKTLDGFYLLDNFNFRTRYNVVQPSPSCPVCSDKLR